MQLRRYSVGCDSVALSESDQLWETVTREVFNDVVVPQPGCAWPASEVPPLSLFLDHAPLLLAYPLLLKRKLFGRGVLRGSGRHSIILPDLVSAVSLETI